MRTFLLFLCGIFTISISAQTTSIPDQGFEQALIDLGIDSDQTLNGQVLTSDVASVTSLDFSDEINGFYYMQNIDGIEDFSSLKFLNLSEVGLMYYNSSLDLSSLTMLEELNLGGYGDVQVNYIKKVLLTNNPNLKTIYGDLETINLTGSDTYISNLTCSLGQYFPDANEISFVCVEVTNPVQAENGQGIYSTWNISSYVNFSEDCSLSESNFKEIKIQLFPNPTTQQFQLKTNEEIKSLTVYSLNGKEILKFQNQNTYDVSQLPAGIYFVKMETSKGTGIQKLIKN
ncbi:putative secreted protein (Por secretion system target) [Mesonia algae]|uniref:Putative secreted protein (Por secretion system target) n=1 Tax=Mesonia algae TaxID=213248 RepID=A0A2W7JYV0_9FLAO|nr:T9SS type A sorting domain-containing protein [Mesonia algae]PZW40680.1 putative secreted protein (Por secretion system target) [Mesonia algae]